MQSETHTLVVLCSLHVALCSAVAGVLYFPIGGVAAASMLGALAALALGIAWRTSRAWHRRHALLVAMRGLAAGD